MAFDEQQRRAMRGQLLNLVAAAEAHVTWKMRLGHHVRGTIREPLESALFGQDGICRLGAWLNSPVSVPYRETEAWLRLDAAHWDFHRLGAIIIGQLRAGDRDGAARLFDGEYSTALHSIINSLTELNRLFQEELAAP
ncbi:MAG: hypothetical protein A2Z95_02225 [Gallionellales bacterium GWA2_60_18]|nr:MAG: hypothetical protein A2Z95_02225 [Gallionellales bacterium GWA2_60_18]